MNVEKPSKLRRSVSLGIIPGLGELLHATTTVSARCGGICGEIVHATVKLVDHHGVAVPFCGDVKCLEPVATRATNMALEMRVLS